MTDPTYTPVIDGFSGFPIPTESHSQRPEPGSVEWLLDAVERHARAEQDALAQYEYLGSASDDPVIALVMQLILEDEERHHGLLKRIESTLRDALNWTRSQDALPTPAPPMQSVTTDLVETAHGLIQEERTGARYLRDLAHREKDVSWGLPSLLIEMMAMDSEKHARLLQFVDDRLAKRPHDDSAPQ
jgi:rubrerythrin